MSREAKSIRMRGGMERDLLLTSVLYAFGDLTLLTRAQEYRLYKKRDWYVISVNGEDVAGMQDSQWFRKFSPSRERWEEVVTQICLEIASVLGEDVGASEDVVATVLNLMYWLPAWHLCSNVGRVIRCTDEKNTLVVIFVVDEDRLASVIYCVEGQQMGWCIDLPTMREAITRIMSRGLWNDYRRFVEEIVEQARNFLIAALGKQENVPE